METPNLEHIKALAKVYSLIRLNDKKPIESGWEKYSHKKRTFEEISFRTGENAGIVCGPASKLIVLDIDNEELFQAAAQSHGWVVPATRTIRTGGGGTHHYFQYPNNGESYGNRSFKDFGFDIRGTGGQVVAPGSVHPETGKLYVVEKDVPAAEPPAWLLDLAVSKARNTSDRGKQKDRSFEPVELAPVNLDSLGLTPYAMNLIQEGQPEGNRSEAIWVVLNALVPAGITDGQIISVFEKYPIGEKYRDKGEGRQAWLLPQISKARDAVNPISIAKAKTKEFMEKLCVEPEFERQADAFLQEILDKSINGIKHGELALKAFYILRRNLERYGNFAGRDHEAALLEVIKAYTDMAQGVSQGRYAFPLATGLGKTQSIVAWVAALYELGVTHISLAVCASKVEALCDLKRDLIKEGVPSDVIGLLHSYNYDEGHAKRYLEDGGELPQGFASIPSTESSQVQEKQILLVTHNRVRGSKHLEVFHLFKEKPRDLLIWDESLFISDNRAVSEIEIKRAIGWWKPGIGRDEKKWAAIDYIEQCIHTLDAELEAQKQEGRQAETIHLPPLTPEQIKEYKRTIGSSLQLTVLPAFLDISQSDLRVVSTPQRGGFVSYDIAVPTELKNIIILDASHNIRELVQYDNTIMKTSKFSDDVVSYEQVTVHQLCHASGRSKMTESFRQAKKEKRLVSLEIAEVIKGIPQGEGAIIFTFKERGGVNFKEILKADLEASGVDVRGKVSVPVWSDGGWKEEEKARFVWLTWGQETSLSQYKYCSNVIFAGVLHRSHVDLASCIVGQQDNLQAALSNSEIQRVERSEIAHCLYQAMSRGSCRVLENSKAKAMNVWLIHKDKEIETWIREVMPGVKWETWGAVHLLAQGEEGNLRLTIMAYLESLPESETRISTSKVKSKLNLEKNQSRTFSRAVKNISEEAGGWKLEGRSLVRVRAGEEYGF
ncbi:MAG: bifunctional DNA primase/polymerase [Syntrophobacteraceae bacterium]